MWEVPLETQQSNIVVDNILAQTTKPELVQYFHVALFSLTSRTLLKSIKLGYLKTRPGLTEGLVKMNLEKSITKTMVNLHMRRQ